MCGSVAQSDTLLLRRQTGHTVGAEDRHIGMGEDTRQKIRAKSR